MLQAHEYSCVHVLHHVLCISPRAERQRISAASQTDSQGSRTTWQPEPRHTDMAGNASPFRATRSRISRNQWGRACLPVHCTHKVHEESRIGPVGGVELINDWHRHPLGDARLSGWRSGPLPLELKRHADLVYYT